MRRITVDCMKHTCSCGSVEDSDIDSKGPNASKDAPFFLLFTSYRDLGFDAKIGSIAKTYF